MPDMEGSGRRIASSRVKITTSFCFVTLTTDITTSVINGAPIARNVRYPQLD